MQNISNKEKQYKRIIIALSIVIPLLVAVLFKVEIKGVDLGFLPPVYASINGLTAILLIIAVRAIRQGKRELHRKLMKTNILLSASFLVMYVLYHMTSEETSFGGEGLIRYIYLFILATHILLSMVIVPLVLFTYLRAITDNFEKHRKLARITFPVWLYVAISGVVVYLMISPYYGKPKQQDTALLQGTEISPDALNNPYLCQ